MLNKIHELEKISRRLEPDANERDHIFQLRTSYIHHFIDHLAETKTYIKADCPKLKSLEITDEGKPFGQLPDIFVTEINQAGINSASGGHLGYIPGGGLWLSSIGDMLAAATNKNSSVFFSGQGAVIMENQLVKWLAGVMGYPSTAHGYEPQLTVSLFRYPAQDITAFNQRLVDALHADGRIFFSATTINGQFWIRCAILSFRTHLKEVDLGIAMIRDCLQKIRE